MKVARHEKIIELIHQYDIDTKDRNSEQTSQEETLEEVFAQLDDLAEKLEDKETSLEDSFNLYKQGMELLKF